MTLAELSAQWSFLAGFCLGFLFLTLALTASFFS